MVHTTREVRGREVQSARKMLITWDDGVEYIGKRPIREIVQPSVWNSSIWISPDGEAYRKYYNPVTKGWGEWEEVPFSLDQAGERMGIHLPQGWTSIETCIATAWLHRAPGSKSHVRVVDPTKQDVTGIEWGEDETDPEGEQDSFRGEKWSPLRWHCGQAECDSRYKISTQGRLFSPHTGKVTRGFAALGTRWAAVKDVGLVNLLAAGGVVWEDVKVPPRVYRAYVHIESGIHPSVHAARLGITEKAAWQYYSNAAPLIHDLKEKGEKFVSPDVWDAMQSMRDDPLLGGKLSDLQPQISRLVGWDVPFEEIRFGRTCVTSE